MNAEWTIADVRKHLNVGGYESEIEAAILAVRRAVGLCRSVQSKISTEVLEKKDRSPVTVADFGSQALVCRVLQQAFPDDPVIGEEDAAELRKPENAGLLSRVCDEVRVLEPGAGDADICAWIDRGGTSTYSGRFWTLDPIDGTKGFLRREQYAVALALIVDGEVAVAVLGCPNLPVDETSPVRGSIFAAVQGGGAAMISITDGSVCRVHVSSLADASSARFCESVEAGHSSHGDAAAVAAQLGITKEAVRLDSQAKYVVVARGEADIYLRLPTRPGYVERIWDHAAGVLVVTEAGGTATDMYGKPLEFRHGRGLERNKGVIVTNGKLHEAVIKTLADIGIGVPA